MKIFQRVDNTIARKTLAIYWQEIKKQKSRFIIYTTLIPLSRMLYSVIIPLLLSYIVQSVFTNPTNWQLPLILLGGVAVAAMTSILAGRLGFKALFGHNEHLVTQLTTRAMTTLGQHSDQFFAHRKVGALAGDVRSFGHSIMDFLNVIYMSASDIVINFTVSLIVVAILAPALLVPLGIVTILVVIMSANTIRRRSPLRIKRKNKLSELNGLVADILGNQQVVRYFSGNAREIASIVRQRRTIEHLAAKESAIIHQEINRRQAVLALFQIITIAVCVWLSANGMLSIAAFVFAVTYLGRLTSSLYNVSPIITGIEQTLLDASTVTEILDEPLEVQDAPNAKKLTVTQGAISLDAVSFAYSDGDSVLHNVTLNIPAGQRVGLAGQSGGGKTTLTKLLLRFADVTAGVIAIDGQNINTITQDSLRSQIAYVPQEPLLFHRSLRDNIAYGRPDATDKAIWNAIRQANALNFVQQLPAGLDTIVGERGIKLSGGQRQRIAIARAILKDAPILILDEATSALDSESEKLIQDALKQLMKGRTCLVVAHRLSTIANLDRIVVLNQGQVVEDDTHKELLQKQDGIYANLWNHQSGGFIEE